MNFIKILLLTFFIVFGMGVVSLSAQQENVCYLAVSVKDQSTIEEKAEEVFREIKIEMKFSNGMQKNWEQIAKELKFDSVKQMINVHKEDKNWNKYKEVFNKPQKFDQAIFLIKKKTENEFEINPSLVYEIGLSLVSRYITDVKPLPPSGIASDACIYNVLVTVTDEKIISTITAEDFNAYGESKKKGEDGVQASILKALYGSIEPKRVQICEDYGSFLNQECSLMLAEKELEKSECWLDVNSNEQMATDVIDEKLVAEIATSLISQYLDEIKYYEKPKFKNLFIEDESTTKSDKEEFNKQIDIILNQHECLYKVFPKKEDDNIIVTFSGKNLNAYGNSKKSGSDGLQEAMLMALFRALEGKRKKICQDYGQILIEPCKIEAVSFEKTDANFRIRGFLQNDKKSNYNLNNISYLVTLKDWWGYYPEILANAGIGQTFLNYQSESSSGAKFKASVTSLDFAKTYVIEGKPKETLNKFRSIIMDVLPIKSKSGEWFLIPGVGIVFPNIIPIPLIYQGELDVSSQYGNFSTKKAFGYSFFGILGMELAEWEMLLGLRWSKVEFSDIKSGASNFSLSGTNFMFGLGWGF